MERPQGSNADEWALWLEHWAPETTKAPEGGAASCAFIAVQIAEAIDDGRRQAEPHLEKIIHLVLDQRQDAENTRALIRVEAMNGLEATK